MKFHFTNGTMRATSSKKMTAILLGLTLALAPYGMTNAEAAAQSGTEAAPAVTAVVPPADTSGNAKTAVKEDKENKEEATAVKDEAQAAPVKEGATKEDVSIDARSSLDQAFDRLAEVKNGTYDMDLAASAPMGSTGMTSHITFVSEPYTRAKGTMQITFTLPGAPVFERELAYYIRETEKATAFYCKLGHGAWEKSVTPRKPADKKVNDFWSEAFSNGFMDIAKDVEFGVQDGTSQTYLVTVDGKAFGKMLEEQVKPTAKDETMQKTVAEICRSLPDFTYTVTIDTEKNMLTDVHANLTDPIRKAASIIVKRRDLPRSERDKILKDIRESTVDFHLQGRDFNALEDVQVPAEVLANAKATELPLGN
ncbi:MAG: hypothetical protein ACI4OH_09910 [Mitsuokella sp.]|uniref:hypothetical protein n=1 Tax=Mitsuokella sp. TaxID=2049034 RepID=UPI003F08CC65